MAHPVEHVYYNDGTDPNVFAVVISQGGAAGADLWLAEAGVATRIVRNVERLEPEDYSLDNNGAGTWHLNFTKP